MSQRKPDIGTWVLRRNHPSSGADLRVRFAVSGDTVMVAYFVGSSPVSEVQMDRPAAREKWTELRYHGYELDQ